MENEGAGGKGRKKNIV